MPITASKGRRLAGSDP